MRFLKKGMGQIMEDLCKGLLIGRGSRCSCFKGVGMGIVIEMRMVLGYRLVEQRSVLWIYRGGVG